MQKLLPIGVRNFEEIRKKEKFCIDINKFVMSIEEDYVYPYVDKTKELLRLVEDNNFCFFANNRKVGKSLTLSTLEAMFQKKDELFEGLYVEDWVEARGKIPNPVLKFDMEDLSKCENLFEFNDIIVAYIKAYLNHYNVSIKISPYTFIVAWQLFPKAIKALYKKYGKVVILIDDYDKAMYNNLGEPERIRGFLSSFYLNLETCSKYLKFVMITGPSDVNKIALLSGLNNLKDISESEKYTDIFGFTQKELENNFIDWIKSASEEISVSKIELLDKLKEYKDSYGDFAFNLKTKLYNPFSVLYFLKNYKESLKQVDENKDSVKKLVDSRTKVKERVENYIEVTLDETVLKQLGYEVKYKREMNM